MRIGTVRLLVILYFIFVPITIVNVFVGGRRVEVSLVLASLIAFAWLVGFLRSRLGVGRDDAWSVWFLLFLCVAAASLLASPYLRGSYALGSIQVIATTAILLASVYIGRHVSREPARFTACIRALMLSVGVVAAIGAWQFVAFNVLHTNFLADFSFMNRLRWPGARETVWNNPGFLGPGSLYRANSIAIEPSHFVEILGTMLGVVLLRTGLMGKAFGRSLSRVVPLWVVVFVLAGFFVAISIIGYLLLGLTVAFLMVVLYRFDLRSLRRVLSIGAVTLVLGVIAIFLTGEAFVSKLKTIPLIFSAVTGGVQTLAPEQVSSLSLASNLFVVFQNLGDHLLFGVGPGGHPLSYDVHAPDWVRAQSFFGVQKMDGGSLFIRLLSETGVVGISLFLIGCLFVVLRARRAIHRALASHRENASRPSIVLTLAVGITASCAALFTVYLIRKGVYYDPPLWTTIALTAAVPPLLNRVYGNSAEADGILGKEHSGPRRGRRNR